MGKFNRELESIEKETREYLEFENEIKNSIDLLKADYSTIQRINKL